jgi:molecular chaperone GrpE
MLNSSKPGEAAEGDGEYFSFRKLTAPVATAQLTEMYLSALADFDNYRRRVQSGKRLSLLLDWFRPRFPAYERRPASALTGVPAIYRTLLEPQGVTPFDSRGKTFDPTQHEAVASVDTDAYNPGIVVDGVQRSYRRGDELLRPACVRVAR